MVSSTEQEKLVFNEITSNLCLQNKLVSEGNMMSSPGIKYKTKVFAFYHDQSMIFKLGKGYNIDSVGVKAYSYLNPFKNKPPMKGWFVIPSSEINLWPELA
ncbi:MAG: hypothetical protein ACW99Q_13370, partial [Candidatus Kariarchaeaceae archaeon]